MNSNNLIIFFLFLVLITTAFSCKNSTTGNNPDLQQDSVLTNLPLEIIQLSGQPISLVVTTQLAIIREEPSLDAIEIARKSKGDSLLFTNKITGFNTPIKLEGIAYNEPWLRVILEGNQMGWVYGGNINFNAAEHAELKEKVLDQRAVALFGKNLAQLMAIYQKETLTTTTVPAFRTLYNRADILKDSLEYLMAIHLQTSDSKELPNFFWLNELMDGLDVYYIQEQHKYYLFRDLKFWHNISLKTTHSTQDDAFVEVLLAAYPSDSLEYLFYGWQLPIDSTITCSLLGSYIHQNVLNKIELAMDSNSYFKTEILDIKKAVVDDISISNHYWLPLERIQEELQAIITRKYPVLTTSDWVELKTRRQLLKDYNHNDIVLNLFEGR